MGYLPSAGDALTILTASSVTGSFGNAPAGSRFPVESFGGTPYFATPSYTSMGVVLSNFSPVPEPSAALAACALAAAAGIAWRRRNLSPPLHRRGRSLLVGRAARGGHCDDVGG